MLTSSAAKKKVKSHVNKYGHESGFEINYRHVAYWFGVINRAAFRNTLPVPKFVLNRMKDTWGWCISDPKSTVIKINSNIDNRELFLATLAHEMVHQYQYINEGKMTHQGSFKEWKQYFKHHMKISI